MRRRKDFTKPSALELPVENEWGLAEHMLTVMTTVLAFNLQ